MIFKRQSRETAASAYVFTIHCSLCERVHVCVCVCVCGYVLSVKMEMDVKLFAAFGLICLMQN